MDKWQVVNAVGADSGLPTLASVDVLVVGAGAAGVAAATIAAEAGFDTLVVEAYGFPGGAAVAGLSGTVCGLFSSVDDFSMATPEQLVHGFAERFRAELEARGGVTEPQRYGHTFAVTHDPLIWRESGDALLSDSGARVLFHTKVIASVVEGGKILGVVVSSKLGRTLIRARRVIDASGDAAVVTRAGLETTVGDNGVVQNPTMNFRLGNVDLDQFTDYWGADTISPPKVVDLLNETEAEYESMLPRKKIWVFPTTRHGELLMNATRISGPGGRSLNPLDPEDYSFAEIQGRKQARDYANFMKKHIPGCQHSFMMDTGVEAGIRQTRSIRGCVMLANDDVEHARKRADGVVRSAWPIELHAGEKPKLHWIVDDYYEIPFGALVPAVGENIIVAGRCLSAEHEALASARVTAQCFEMGQAAAIATELSLKGDESYRKIQGERVRELMEDRGSTF